MNYEGLFPEGQKFGTEQLTGKRYDVDFNSDESRQQLDYFARELSQTMGISYPEAIDRVVAKLQKDGAL